MPTYRGWRGIFNYQLRQLTGAGEGKESPLIAAVLSGNLEVVKILLKNKANINWCNKSGQNAMHICVSAPLTTQMFNIAKVLLFRKKLDFNARDDQDRSYIDVASSSAMKLLLRSLVTVSVSVWTSSGCPTCTWNDIAHLHTAIRTAFLFCVLLGGSYTGFGVTWTPNPVNTVHVSFLGSQKLSFFADAASCLCRFACVL